MKRLPTGFESRSKGVMMALTLGLVGVIGVADFLTGFELYFFSIYLVPITLAAWYVGRGYGVFISTLCVAASVTGDFLAGAHYSSRFVPVWNAAIAVVFYLAVVLILSKLRALQNDLEERVRQRTAALHAEMQERQRLEKEILRISEREQLRIGHDLHDSLCQHLTGIALAGEVLSEQLAKTPAQAKAANHIVDMVEESIELTRRLARGLHSVEWTEEGFIDALHELASNVTDRFKIACHFECDRPTRALDPDAATHLYRIAQEASTNAAKHGKPSEINIRLQFPQDRVILTVTDDGIGFSPDQRAGNGLGLRIMAHRAKVIGADFTIAPLPAGGTGVTCVVPSPSTVESYAAHVESISS
jgi:signal transduction histidine kinase